MKLKTFKKGQGTLEYAIIIVVVVGALIAMQWYIKGGYQGKLRQASDDMGQQFSPTKYASNWSTTYGGGTNQEVFGGGNVNDPASNYFSTATVTYNQTQTKDGSETVNGYAGTGDER